ncbi:MAG: diguanylate cyclase [Deltaproteobacteria bacterium]|nr:diguanylate cyclase [Deltaproteobacteria bacterium]
MGYSVLIIDDSEQIRKQIREILRETKVFTDLHEASDGLTGFKMLMQHPIDLVLCDLLMPVCDGFKFLLMKRRRVVYKDVPVILLTGAEDLRNKVRGLEQGASDYLVKPFDERELIARVKVQLKIKDLQDELKIKNARLSELSVTDGLTNIYNRRYLREKLEVEFNRCSRYNLALAYMMFDLDHFKAVNDRYGHMAGDYILVEVAAILKRNSRKPDLVARFGGEEFAMLLPNTQKKGAVALAERVREDVEGARFTFEKHTISQTLSAGVVLYPHPDIHSADQLIQKADHALFKAKEGGRNRVVLAS